MVACSQKGGSTVLCKCGGILFVIRVETPPENLSRAEKLVYDRLCDVQCNKCGKILYSQPYDFGRNLNAVRDTSNSSEK